MGIFVRILKVFSDKLFFLHLARRLILLFANKKKDLVRIELTFLQEVSIIVRVNMKLCRKFFYPFLLLAISKQQK